MSFSLRKRKGSLLAFLLSLLFLFALCSCKKTEELPEEKSPDVFPANTVLANVDLSGMTAEEAENALRSAVQDYTLEVTLDGVTFSLSAPALGLTYQEEFDTQALLSGLLDDAQNTSLLSNSPYTLLSAEEIQSAMISEYTAAALQSIASAESTVSDSADDTDGDADAASEPTADTAEDGETDSAQDQIELLRDETKASIVYDESAGRFVGVDGKDGESTDYTAATEQVINAASHLEPKISVVSEMVVAHGEAADSSDAVAAALDQANRYLDVSLTYSFTPANGSTSTETIASSTIASWLVVQADGLSVELDTDAISSYCSTLASKHSVSGSNTSKFKTTAGSYINVKVATAGQTVDSTALYQDVYECVSNFTSGQRTAVYSSVSETSEYVDFGGSYVEIDLTNQMVYCYKNGTLLVSSPCVTGSVAGGHATPTGVYSIFSMDTNRYLVGNGYKSWVNYFMPFNGGIGLHDASWRQNFGGTYYLYNGSHGCINMPYSAVKKIFENVSVGTKVIVYGGVTKVAALTQSWSGSKSYEVTVGSDSFKLDAAAKDNATLTYSSSNTAVCTVSNSGVVTPVAEGTATITVSAAATAQYKASSTTVKITVKPKAETPKAQTISGVSSLSITVGDSAKLGQSASTSLTYTSADSSIAKVSSKGTVTAVSAGKTTITVTAAAENGYQAATKKITITVKKAASNPGTQPEDPGSNTVQPEKPGSSTVEPETPGSSTVEPESPGSSTVEPENPGSSTVQPENPGSSTVTPEPESPDSSSEGTETQNDNGDHSTDTQSDDVAISDVTAEEN